MKLPSTFGSGLGATRIDGSFAGLPLRKMADAALKRAIELDVSYAEFHTIRLREQTVNLRDAQPDGGGDSVDIGIAVRVVHDGTWGFAADVIPTVAAAAELAEHAVAVARVCRPLNREPVVLAAESAYGERVWVSDYATNPFDLDDADKVALLAGWSRDLLAHHEVDHVDATFRAVQENKFFADLGGTRLHQQRVRTHAVVTVIGVDAATGGFESMSTTAPPAGRGWEYLNGDGWDWSAELAALPELLAEKLTAPSVEPGKYDLVIDPTNLWLTIHESIGHATELDRALGHEAAYAGTSFATTDRLGTLRYGSSAMTVTADRTTPYALATVGWDDEGVPAQCWDLIRDGVLVGYQSDRRTAALTGIGEGRSTGCAYTDSYGHIPLLRMANVNLSPAAGGPSTAELIGRVERGLYIVGDKSYSIDQERYNFQFTGQRAHLIVDGRLAGQVRDFAYQSSTPEFWGALEATGGPATYLLGGAFNCGKGQPTQDAPVSHGAPTALFRGITVLNTLAEVGE